MLGPGVGSVREAREIREGLVVESEARVRIAGDGFIPASRVPRPAHAGVAQAVTDSRCSLVWYERVRTGIGGMGTVDGVRHIRAGVIHDVAIRGELPVVDVVWVIRERRGDHIRRSIGEL